MKERPINLKAHEVLAILDGRKTQLRRVVKPQPSNSHLFQGWVLDSTSGNDIGKAAWAIGNGPLMQDVVRVRCPFGQVGDRLWGRETWMYLLGDDNRDQCSYRADAPSVSFDSEARDYGLKWRPPINMPRSASRILLEVASVKVQRLHDISEADAQAEGIKALSKDGRTVKYGVPDRDGLPGNDDYGWHWHNWLSSAVLAYRQLWDQINGYGLWEENPWVWVVEFRRINKKGGAA